MTPAERVQRIVEECSSAWSCYNIGVERGRIRGGIGVVSGGDYRMKTAPVAGAVVLIVVPRKGTPSPL